MTCSGTQSGPATVRNGLLLYLAGMVIFSIQDAVSKVLVADYPVSQLLMIRYWIFLVVAVVYAARTQGLGQTFASKRPVLQILRSVLVAAETAVFIFGLRYLGLAETHAIFALSPLLATALAGLLLREPIGWRRMTALAVGFAGALLIIKPGMSAFNMAAIIPLTAALMFAFYNVITRYTGQVDSAQTSLLFMALAGVVMMTPLGLLSWTAPDLRGWALFAGVSLGSLAAHFMLIKALQFAQASQLQPLNYSLLVSATIIGLVAFGERPDLYAVIGAVLIVSSGLFTLFREQYLARQQRLGLNRSSP
ncbi:DMT family transporter [Rhodoligotrophos ferricapiens]|uniref:DMT family transporter n=1 Tax=Rhodoligotrophos ferricapiens TaxID=3069264 RepID=UPI00315C8965